MITKEPDKAARNVLPTEVAAMGRKKTITMAEGRFDYIDSFLYAERRAGRLVNLKQVIRSLKDPRNTFKEGKVYRFYVEDLHNPYTDDKLDPELKKGYCRINFDTLSLEPASKEEWHGLSLDERAYVWDVGGGNRPMALGVYFNTSLRLGVFEANPTTTVSWVLMVEEEPKKIVPPQRGMFDRLKGLVRLRCPTWLMEEDKGS